MAATTESELVELLRRQGATELRQPNLELKRSWDGKYGEKLSALGNRFLTGEAWLVVGVEDDGTLAGHDETWARKTEETISQHINQKLSPVGTCRTLRAIELDKGWVIVAAVANPGDVVYWGSHAYTASGTTTRELKPQEVLELRLRLPGLADFTRAETSSAYAPDLVAQFAENVLSRASGQNLPTAPAELLAALGVDKRQAARLLFGECLYRTIAFSSSGEVMLNDTQRSLYRLLQSDFLGTLQARANIRVSPDLYPARGLREALANAVAHAAYFERDGEICVEFHPDKLVISNLCTDESRYFANRWFSRSHHTQNGLLMETLRLAGDVDELGRGKSLIFSEFIKAGRRPPEVVIERAGRLSRWKLTLFATSSTTHYSRLLERCRTVYQDDMRALIAVALVLWRNKSVSEIREYADGDFAAQFAAVLSSLDGPIFYSAQADQIFLTRWARILLGEGKDSKELSRVEENQLFAQAHDHCWRLNAGEITPRDLRRLGQMGDTMSEKSLSSRIIAKWTAEGRTKRLAKGRYKFTTPPATRGEVRGMLEELLARLRDPTGQPPRQS